MWEELACYYKHEKDIEVDFTRCIWCIFSTRLKRAAAWGRSSRVDRHWEVRCGSWADIRAQEAQHGLDWNIWTGMASNTFVFSQLSVFKSPMSPPSPQKRLNLCWFFPRSPYEGEGRDEGSRWDTDPDTPPKNPACQSIDWGQSVDVQLACCEWLGKGRGRGADLSRNWLVMVILVIIGVTLAVNGSIPKSASVVWKYACMGVWEMKNWIRVPKCVFVRRQTGNSDISVNQCIFWEPAWRAGTNTHGGI